MTDSPLLRSAAHQAIFTWFIFVVRTFCVRQPGGKRALVQQRARCRRSLILNLPPRPAQYGMVVYRLLGQGAVNAFAKSFGVRSGPPHWRGPHTHSLTILLDSQLRARPGDAVAGHCE